MRERTFSTLGLFFVAILSISFWGIHAGIWMIIILTLATQFEFYKLIQKAGFRTYPTLGITLGAFILISAWYSPSWTTLTAIDASVAILTLTTVGLSLFIFSKPLRKKAPQRLITTLLGLIYIPFMLQFYIQLVRIFANINKPLAGLLITIWLILVAKLTDIGGLLIGSCIGKRKLAPKVSPNKTWEGAIGGVVVAVTVGMILHSIISNWIPSAFTQSNAFILGILISIVSIASDLIESMIKRQAGAKDSGKVIPGIGGAFDLMDSLILTAPIGYYFCKLTLF